MPKLLAVDEKVDEKVIKKNLISEDEWKAIINGCIEKKLDGNFTSAGKKRQAWEKVGKVAKLTGHQFRLICAQWRWRNHSFPQVILYQESYLIKMTAHQTLLLVEQNMILSNMNIDHY